MSTRYNTGNPIESADVRDMSDNAKNFDLFSNSTTISFSDRLGVGRKTIHGMNSEFDGQILNMGYSRVGTFATGGTITNPRQVLLWGIADGGDGQEYGWTGSFPKTVPASSNPNNAGGIGEGSWVSRFDPAIHIQLREAQRRSYEDAGYNLVDGSFAAGFTLVNINDVALDETTGKAFSGAAGTYPPNTSTSGFSDKSGAVKKRIITTTSSIIGGSFKAGDLLEVSDRAGAHFIIESGVADGFSKINVGAGLVASLQTYDNPVNLRWFTTPGAADDSDAFQAALDTGLAIYNYDPTPLTVTKRLQSKANELIGDWVINPTRSEISGLGKFTFSSRKNKEQPETMKMMYVMRAYDLVEMMYIRSIGANYIFHAGALHIDRPGLPDTKAALKLAIDCAYSADLKVNMTTGFVIAEDYQAIEYVNYFKDHPAVWGFSVFDEPSFNNMSVARQNERISALRALTTKNLNTTDVIQNYPGYRSGANPFSANYDTFFVNAYCHYGKQPFTLAEKVKKDLHDFRVAAGAAKLLLPSSKIIPVCGIFLHNGFTESIEHVKLSYADFPKMAGGDVGFWAWDPVEHGLSASMLTNLELRNFAAGICKMTVAGESYPKARRFGVFGDGVSPACSNPDGLGLIVKQQFASTGGSNQCAYGVLTNGTSAEWVSPNAGVNGLGGLFFRTQFPWAVLDQEVGEFTSVCANIFDVNGASAGNMYLRYTPDGGITKSPMVYIRPISLAPPNKPSLFVDIYLGSGEYWRGHRPVLGFDFASEYQFSDYRFGMQGYFVSSEW